MLLRHAVVVEDLCDSVGVAASKKKASAEGRGPDRSESERLRSMRHPSELKRGTGKVAAAAKLPGARISPKPFLGKCVGEKAMY
jgi:hypothetical protein